MKGCVSTSIATAPAHCTGCGAQTKVYCCSLIMHITLKFLGDVPNVEVPDVCKHVAGAVADIEPFEIEFQSAGAFHTNDRPKTLWLGVAPGEGLEQLAALNAAIEERLHKEMGFPKEHRRFQPHLTIGRVNQLNAAQHASAGGGTGIVAHLRCCDSVGLHYTIPL